MVKLNSLGNFLRPGSYGIKCMVDLRANSRQVAGVCCALLCWHVLYWHVLFWCSIQCMADLQANSRKVVGMCYVLLFVMCWHQVHGRLESERQTVGECMLCCAVVASRV